MSVCGNQNMVDSSGCPCRRIDRSFRNIALTSSACLIRWRACFCCPTLVLASRRFSASESSLQSSLLGVGTGLRQLPDPGLSLPEPSLQLPSILQDVNVLLQCCPNLLRRSTDWAVLYPGLEVALKVSGSQAGLFKFGCPFRGPVFPIWGG